MPQIDFQTFRIRLLFRHYHQPARGDSMRSLIIASHANFSLSRAVFSSVSTGVQFEDNDTAHRDTSRLISWIGLSLTGN